MITSLCYTFLIGIFGLNDGELASKLNEDFENLAPISLLFDDTCPSNNRKSASKRIREFYLGNRPIDKSTRAEVTDVRIVSIEIQILYL